MPFVRLIRGTRQNIEIQLGVLIKRYNKIDYKLDQWKVDWFQLIFDMPRCTQFIQWNLSGFEEHKNILQIYENGVAWFWIPRYISKMYILNWDSITSRLSSSWNSFQRMKTKRKSQPNKFEWLKRMNERERESAQGVGGEGEATSESSQGTS